MPLDEALKALMITSGSFMNVASRDVYGKRVGGSPVTFKCHLTLNKNDSYESETTRQTVSGVMIMDGVYNIQKNAIITVEGVEFKPLKITTFYDEVGANHTSVELD
jgi:hypothetical protein